MFACFFIFFILVFSEVLYVRSLTTSRVYPARSAGGCLLDWCCACVVRAEDERFSNQHLSESLRQQYAPAWLGAAKLPRRLPQISHNCRHVRQPARTAARIWERRQSRLHFGAVQLDRENSTLH